MQGGNLPTEDAVDIKPGQSDIPDMPGAVGPCHLTTEALGCAANTAFAPSAISGHAATAAAASGGCQHVYAQYRTPGPVLHGWMLTVVC